MCPLKHYPQWASKCLMAEKKQLVESCLNFQQAESDLDYIQHRLEFEIRKSLPDNSSPEEDPLAVLEALSMLKSRYKTLCMRMEKVSQEQRECMKGIRVALGKTMRITWSLQQQADLKRAPLSEEERAAAELLMYPTPQELEALAEETSFEQFADEQDEHESQ